jgi:uncharacterized membrane protein
MKNMEEQQTIHQLEVKIPEPEFSRSFGHGWDTMKKYFPGLLVVLLLLFVFSLPVGFLNGIMKRGFSVNAVSGLINVAYGIIVLGPISYGATWVFLKAVRNELFKTYDMFMAFQDIWNIVLANLLVSIIVGVGFVLLIVPGIIFACKLTFVPFLVMDKKMEAVAAIKKSWAMTKGYSWTIFGMAIVSIFIAIAGLICLGVGIFPAIIWIECAFATLYWGVSVRQAGS